MLFSIKEARKPREATNNLKVQPADLITDEELKAKLKIFMLIMMRKPWFVEGKVDAYYDMDVLR